MIQHQEWSQVAQIRGSDASTNESTRAFGCLYGKHLLCNPARHRWQRHFFGRWSCVGSWDQIVYLWIGNKIVSECCCNESRADGFIHAGLTFEQSLMRIPVRRSTLMHSWLANLRGYSAIRSSKSRELLWWWWNLHLLLYTNVNFLHNVYYKAFQNFCPRVRGPFNSCSARYLSSSSSISRFPVIRSTYSGGTTFVLW